jgi:hypothetical protein
MAAKIGLTLDCAHPTKLAEFWKLALGYQDEPPPAPFATREEWLEQFDLEDDESDDAAWLHDPSGLGPRLSLQQVPEPKVGKIRLHLDIRLPGEGTPDERWRAVTAKVDKLTSAGATSVEVYAGHHVVLADPEGNEFCVC